MLGTLEKWNWLCWLWPAADVGHWHIYSSQKTSWEFHFCSVFWKRSRRMDHTQVIYFHFVFKRWVSGIFTQKQNCKHRHVLLYLWETDKSKAAVGTSLSNQELWTPTQTFQTCTTRSVRVYCVFVIEQRTPETLFIHFNRTEPPQN